MQRWPLIPPWGITALTGVHHDETCNGDNDDQVNAIAELRGDSKKLVIAMCNRYVEDHDDWTNMATRTISAIISI